MAWVDTDTGELVEGDCPKCAHTEVECEAQMRAMELELRRYRGKVARLEKEAERQAAAKRDGDTWKAIFGYWKQVFPDKRPSAKTIKSARADAVFRRLESGADVQDVKDAIIGARLYPYVVYGHRRQTGSASDLADDLQQIVELGRDDRFDFLRDAGRAYRESH